MSGFALEGFTGRATYKAPPIVTNPQQPVDAGTTPSAKTADMFRNLVIDAIRGSLAMKSTREYLAYWDGHFPQVADALHALQTIERMSSSTSMVVARNVEHSSNAAVRDLTLAAFGEARGSEFDFASRTFLGALDLVFRFQAMPAPTDPVADLSLAGSFHLSGAFWTIGTASIYLIASGMESATPDVVQAVFDFSRAGALNAYASARQGFDLRSPRDEDSAERPLPALDDEDRALLEDGREDVEKLIKRATQAD